MKELNNDSDVNFLPSNIISEKILISDNTIFKEKINDFLIDLESKYNDFISKSFNIQNNWKEFQQNKKNSNVFIMPEPMLIKSPTTILNALEEQEKHILLNKLLDIEMMKKFHAVYLKILWL